MKRYSVRATSYIGEKDEDWIMYKNTNWWIVAIYRFIVFGFKYDYVDMQRRK